MLPPAALLVLLALLAPPAAAQAAADLVARDDGAGGGYAYEPFRLEVAPGALVRVVAQGGEPHTVTPLEAGAFEDLVLQPGEDGTLRAPESPGEYRFYCRFHAARATEPGQGMAGVLVVAEDAPADATPPGGGDLPPTPTEAQDERTPLGGPALLVLAAASGALLARRTGRR